MQPKGELYHLGQLVPYPREGRVSMQSFIGILGLRLFAVVANASQLANASVLPDALTPPHVMRQAAHWTIPDIVEISRIEGTAIQGSSRIAAFILKQPSLADGKNHYGLYELDADRGGAPHKIASAEYMADLAWRPQTDEWTVRADFGSGVQLYTVKRSGQCLPLLVNTDTAVVGGNEGILGSATDPRSTGVVSYGWSQDGRRLWFARLRHRDRVSQNALLDDGIVFDDHRMAGLSSRSVDAAVTIASYELRVFDTADRSDHLVATSSAKSAGAVFGGDDGSVNWVDAQHLQYRELSTETGTGIWSLWRFDLASGKAVQVTTASPDDVYYSTPTEAGYLTIRQSGAIRSLVEVDLGGHVTKNYGEVSARRLAGGAFWRAASGDKFIYGTHLYNRNGLDAAPKSALSKALAAIPDYISACSFNSDLSFGLCSDETISKAPTLVSVSGATGALTVLARPNARYDAIAPLQSVRKEWTNRYGAKNNGYVTYPRDYVSGRSYPALVVTHASDAQNAFARDGFQWEFPIQVMAERGYFILSVNEPDWDPSEPAPSSKGGANVSVARQQFNHDLNPTASLEAAVKPLIASGEVDGRAVGIAGYSRGAEVTYFAISHSKVFSAASLGDDPGVTPNLFWSGVSNSRAWVKGLYGGSPFDDATLDNYKKYSTAFRLAEIRAPLLQQFASTHDAESGLLSDQLLKDAGIPSELVDYTMESHIFYAPRHRASAMWRNLEWFNYWLRGIRDPDPAKTDQYLRWDAMAARWRPLQ